MKISQREARRLKQRVDALERKLSGLATPYPNGTHFCTILWERDWLRGRIEGVRMTGQAVVLVNEENKLKLYAVKVPA